MSPAMIQFLVAGALVAAWTWMLGRPLLVEMLGRARRAWSGRVPVQLDRPDSSDGGAGPGVVGDGPRPAAWYGPVGQWRAQPIEKRRLQLLLAFAFATFAAALLAIALRGPFVHLFLLMAACLGAHLAVGAYIGSRQLRSIEAARRTARAEARFDKVGADDGPAGGSDLLADGGLDGRLFDEGFFEPIPELGPPAGDGARTDPDRSIFDPAPAADPAAAADPVPAPDPAAADLGREREEPSFKVPPVRRGRQPKRDKGRPIYVEPPAPDQDDESWRAVND